MKIYGAMPIPARLLKDSAVLLVPSQSGLFDSEYTELPLSRVLVRRKRKLSLTKANTAASSSAVLYYDCVNSRPSGLIFDESMKLRVDGRTMRISELEAPSSGGVIHHYKAVLV